MNAPDVNFFLITTAMRWLADHWLESLTVAAIAAQAFNVVCLEFIWRRIGKLESGAAILAACLLCSPAVAGTYRADVPMFLTVKERISGVTQTESVNVSVPMYLHTDYRELSWELDLDGIEATLSGDPSGPFEARIALDGSVSSGLLDLSFPDADGRVVLPHGSYVTSASWTFTERIVDQESSHTGSVVEAVAHQARNQALNVSAHPNSVSYTMTNSDYNSFPGATGIHLGTNIPDTIGVTLSWSTYYYDAAFPADFFPVMAGDFNDDGAVGAADFIIARNGGGLAPLLAPESMWRANYHQPSGAAAAVPEPSVGLLAAVAFSTLAWRRQRWI